MFVIHNITCSDVEYIHFVEEGEDVFYVTCYGEDGLEFLHILSIFCVTYVAFQKYK